MKNKGFIPIKDYIEMFFRGISDSGVEQALSDKRVYRLSATTTGGLKCVGRITSMDGRDIVFLRAEGLPASWQANIQIDLIQLTEKEISQISDDYWEDREERGSQGEYGTVKSILSQFYYTPNSIVGRRVFGDDRGLRPLGWISDFDRESESITIVSVGALGGYSTTHKMDQVYFKYNENEINQGVEKEESNVEIIYMKANAQSLHVWIAHLRGHAIGHVHALEESDGRIKMLDAWVDEKHRGRGVYRQLWDARMKFIQSTFPGRKVYAWCKPSSLQHNVNQGFEMGETVTYVEKTV